VFNMARSNSAVTLSAGELTVGKDLSTPYFDTARDLWLCAWSLQESLPADGPVRIAIPSHDSGAQIEPGFSRKVSDLPEYPQAEIAGFVVRIQAQP
jgi:hypothetical protein